MVIHYRLHPLHGESAEVIGEYDEAERVLIVQPANGRRLYVPAWMTEPSSATVEIRTIPRLSLAALADLSRVLVGIRSSTSTDPSACGVSVKKRHRIRQLELLAPSSPEGIPALPEDALREVREALQKLLVESSWPNADSRRGAMSKITPDHLSRSAIVYIRQSTAEQLKFNAESRRRQYALQERARVLGWSDVIVIDEDLGRSGSGIARPGFERLLAAVCRGTVGAVLSIEALRLASNGRDWHTLLEFCGLVGTLIVDEDGVYEPRHPNDRLLLGMKGTMSELELSLLRQRSHEAIKLKARRGEMFTSVAVGYVRTDRHRIEKDPDERVRAALELVFRKFMELQSVRQVHLWLRQEHIDLPSIEYPTTGRCVQWRAPVYSTVHRLLTNPIYAGAYVYGRSGSTTRIDAGRKRIRRGIPRRPHEWDVLLKGHHESYISWDTFEQHQRMIMHNSTGRGDAVRGPIRRRESLLAGLLRCGHCGRKIHVTYTGKGGGA